MLQIWNLSTAQPLTVTVWGLQDSTSSNKNKNPVDQLYSFHKFHLQPRLLKNPICTLHVADKAEQDVRYSRNGSNHWAHLANCPSAENHFLPTPPQTHLSRHFSWFSLFKIMVQCSSIQIPLLPISIVSWTRSEFTPLTLVTIQGPRAGFRF